MLCAAAADRVLGSDEGVEHFLQATFIIHLRHVCVVCGYLTPTLGTAVVAGHDIREDSDKMHLQMGMHADSYCDGGVMGVWVCVHGFYHTTNYFIDIIHIHTCYTSLSVLSSALPPQPSR